MTTRSEFEKRCQQSDAHPVLAAARAVAARAPDLPLTLPDGRVLPAREAMAEMDRAVDRARADWRKAHGDG